MRKGIGLPLVLGILVLTGCTAAGDTTPSSPRPSASIETPREPLAVPTPQPGQLAIASFDNARTPTSGESASGPDVMDGPFRIEGACRGDSFRFRLRDATVGAPERDLVSGVIDCADPGLLSEFRYDLAIVGGPVQMVIVDADRATEGWVRAVRAE